MNKVEQFLQRRAKHVLSDASEALSWMIDGVQKALQTPSVRQLYKRFLCTLFLSLLPVYAAAFALAAPIYIACFVLDLALHMTLFAYLPSLTVMFTQLLIVAPLVGLFVLR